MTKPGNSGSERVIANGVEYNVWRELNTFITWGYMMSADKIRYTESNVISYRDMEFLLDYNNRKITIGRKGEGEVPESLVKILKQVADGAAKQRNMLNRNTIQQ